MNEQVADLAAYLFGRLKPGRLPGGNLGNGYTQRRVAGCIRYSAAQLPWVAHVHDGTNASWDSGGAKARPEDEVDGSAGGRAAHVKSI